MPSAARSTGHSLDGYMPAPPAPAPIVSPAQIVEQAGLQRSPVMLASLPGISSGPDAVLRQFYGGRAAAQTRLYVP